MTFFPLLLVVLFVFTICVAGMAIGVMNGRKPIKHCGGAALDANGNRTSCALCGNGTCKNNPENTNP
jgi:hypothetical protein